METAKRAMGDTAVSLVRSTRRVVMVATAATAKASMDMARDTMSRGDMVIRRPSGKHEPVHLPIMYLIRSGFAYGTMRY